MTANKDCSKYKFYIKLHFHKMCDEMKTVKRFCYFAHSI